MRRSGTASRLLTVVAVLSLLPATAFATDTGAPVACGLAGPSAAPAGPSVADPGLEPTAAATAADTWEPNPTAPSSSATPKAHPAERIFLLYGGGGGHRVCRPGCVDADGHCCDDKPDCPCNWG